jgi:hypothetical protein
LNRLSGDKKPLHALGSLFTFVLICLFAVLSILLVLLGAQAYRHVTERANTNFNIRTSLGYVQGKLRSHDGMGAVRIEYKDGICVLTLEQNIDGGRYETSIYCYHGTLYETLISTGTEFAPEQGEALANLESFNIVFENSGFIITVVDTNHVRYSQFVAQHSIV